MESDAGGMEPVPGTDGGALALGSDNCPIGYYRVPGSVFVCAASNPWRSRSTTWSSIYRGPIVSTALVSGALEPSEGDADLVLRAPAGLDLCERGVASEGMAIDITSEPQEPVASACKRDNSSDFLRFLVRKAYTDHLELEIDGDTTSLDGDALRACYADFVSFVPRLADAWRVTWGLGYYQHRVMTAADGSCNTDTSIDPRWSSITDPSRPYVDPFIAFQLRELAEDETDDVDAKESINPSITLTLDAEPIFINFVSEFPDALPTRMRFFPGTGYLLLVDEASQGLTPIEPWPELKTADSKYR
jgi:hypothetical protein